MATTRFANNLDCRLLAESGKTGDQTCDLSVTTSHVQRSNIIGLHQKTLISSLAAACTTHGLWRADGQTDTHDDSIYRASIASLGMTQHEQNSVEVNPDQFSSTRYDRAFSSAAASFEPYPDVST